MNAEDFAPRCHACGSQSCDGRDCEPDDGLPKTPLGDAMAFLGIDGFGVEPCADTGLWLAYPLRKGATDTTWVFRGRTPEIALRGLLESLGLARFDHGVTPAPECTSEELAY